jgi:20S proteasome alpha/beta subunit
LLGADASVSSNGFFWQATNVDKICEFNDPHVAAAVSGDAADTDRLVALWQMRARLEEYSTSLGSDVRYITFGGSSRDDENTATSTGWTVTPLAQWARTHLSQQLRTSSRYQVGLLIGGLEPVNPSSLAQSPRQEGEEQPQLASSTATHRLQQQIRQASSVEQETIAATTAKAPSSDVPTTATPWQPRLYWVDDLATLYEVPYGAHGLGSVSSLAILDQYYRPDMSREEATALMQRCFAQLRQRYVSQSPHPPCLKLIDASGCHLLTPPAGTGTGTAAAAAARTK